MKLLPDHRDPDGRLTRIYGIPTRWIVVVMMVMLIVYALVHGSL